ncbi:MAG: type III pantothenate kinase [Chlorobi bacterium]|nr:type III pantothenate kinase [Chlorobiota bacterium]MCI0716778.1 type III pantothenate kinase [Chlorobiota bacterium]
MTLRIAYVRGFTMNLAIDIGNSLTHFAVFEGQKEIESFTAATNNFDRSELYNKYFKKYSDKIKAVGISSVVPAVSEIWNQLSEIFFRVKPVFINSKIRLPVKLKVDKPASFGSDRICNSVFGYEYFKRKQNLIVIDFGTANTYDVVLKNGDLVGGIIAPGLETSAKSLNVSTGQLPALKHADFLFKNSIIGKNTIDALRSGLMNYALFATEGIVKSVIKEFKKDFKVIITGGNAGKLKNKFSFKPLYIENTVLKGINLILNYSNKK